MERLRRISVRAQHNRYRFAVHRRGLHDVDNRFADTLFMQADDVADAQSVPDAVSANVLHDGRFPQTTPHHGDHILHRNRTSDLLLRLPIDHRLLLSLQFSLLGTELLSVVVGLVIVVVLLLDAAIFLVADRTAGDRAHGAADQCTCRFVVTFVPDRGSHSRAREPTEDRATATVETILRISVGDDECNQQGR